MTWLTPEVLQVLAPVVALVVGWFLRNWGILAPKPPDRPVPQPVPQPAPAPAPDPNQPLLDLLRQLLPLLLGGRGNGPVVPFGPPAAMTPEDVFGAVPPSVTSPSQRLVVLTDAEPVPGVVERRWPFYVSMFKTLDQLPGTDDVLVEFTNGWKHKFKGPLGDVVAGITAGG